MRDRLPIVVLVRNYTRELSYFDDWRDAIEEHPGFDAKFLNLENSQERREAPRLIRTAHFVLAHHSTTGDGVERLRPLVPALQDRRGKFAVFVANELNLPLAPMAEKLAFLKESHADLVLTQFVQEAGDWYYGGSGLKRVASLPHGLNLRAFTPGKAIGQRNVDIGARSHRYGLFVGDMERMNLFEHVQSHAKEFGLSADIVTDGARLDRAGWAAFLKNTNATIANEAGSFWVDRDDAMLREIELQIAKSAPGKFVLSPKHPAFRFAHAAMPQPVRSFMKKILSGRYVEDFNLDRHTGPAETLRIQREVFTADRRSPHYTKVISSRHFDAIGTKTLQVMTPGRYNDILSPGEHFAELKADFSNFEEIVEIVRDHTAAQ